jgi:LAS superfamily LD-carboxypeptidase LdcB
LDFFVSSLSHLLTLQLLGVDETHLLPVPRHTLVMMHRQAIGPITELINAAAQAGFNLQIASGFRSFERQLLIWNDKCRGYRPVLDKRGVLLNVESLTLVEKVHAILHWSALPGASRHHWGTDCDIYDAAAISPDYRLQLHPDEYIGSGPFVPMMQWLQDWMAQPSTPDFYQPYWEDNHQGIAPEPWHISYRPLASSFARQLSVDVLREHLQGLGDEALAEKEYLLKELDTIYHRYIDPW